MAAFLFASCRGVRSLVVRRAVLPGAARRAARVFGGGGDDWEGRLINDGSDSDGIRVIDVGADYFDQPEAEDSAEDDMEARIREASSAAASGRFAGGSAVGRQDFGDDGDFGAPSFAIEVDASCCPGCGAKFQCEDESRSGYLPRNVFERLNLEGEDDASPEREVEDLIAEALAARGGGAAAEALIIDDDDDDDDDLDELSLEELDALALAGEFDDDDDDDAEDDEEAARALRKLAKKEAKAARTSEVICSRCHGLRHKSSSGDKALRARAGAEDDALTPEAFEDLLKREVKESRGVVILFVDLFDVGGSLACWTRMGSMLGHRRRVLVAANKVDLLPADCSRARVADWVLAAARRSVPFLRDNLKSDDVRLVSCRTGSGVRELLGDARDEAARLGGDVFVCGAANCGKSSFVNRAVGAFNGAAGTRGGKKQFKGTKTWGVTASAQPGTTLGVVKVNLRDSGPDVYDTPGLLSPAALGSALDDAELKAVLPGADRLRPVALRVNPGKSVLLGGLARVDLADADLGAFFLTFFVSPNLKLHPTDPKHVDEAYLAKHVGDLLSPPFDADRLADLPPPVAHAFDVDGAGFDRAAVDIALAGLGWFSVTGSGRCRVVVHAPDGVLVDARDPLLPFENLKATSAKFTGGRVVQKRGAANKNKRAPGKKKKKAARY